MVPCIGNHDVNKAGWGHFLKLFGLPRSWFYVNWGPVHIVVLDSEANRPLLELQATWLEGDLSAHADYMWKMVVFHRNVLLPHHAAFKPAFELGWAQVIDEHKIDIAFNGHTHLYLRSRPLGWDGSNFTARGTYLEGTIYLITGGWGAPLYEHPYSRAWWVASYEKAYHFVVVDIYPNGTLHLQAQDIREETLDEVWIVKMLTSPKRPPFRLRETEECSTSEGLIRARVLAGPPGFEPGFSGSGGRRLSRLGHGPVLSPPQLDIRVGAAVITSHVLLLTCR